MGLKDAKKTMAQRALVEALRGEDGIWRDAGGIALSVSASDLERHTYCPLSWKLARDGHEGKGEAIKTGVKDHEKIHEQMDEFHRKNLDSRREMAVWGWWFSLVVMFAIDAFAFAYIEDDRLSLTESVPPRQLARFLVMLSLSVLMLSIFLIATPWRKWFGWSEPVLPDEPEFATHGQTLFQPVWQTVDFVGGWITAGRVEAMSLLASIIIALHGIALYGADDRLQAAFALGFIALIWCLFSSWRLGRVLRAITDFEDASAEVGFDSSTALTYSDDHKEASMLHDEKTGIRGRPDQIVVIDDAFIPVEQKTGRVPDSPYLSHKIQLLAYLHLIEKSTGIAPPYGALRYGTDTAFPIDWDEQHRDLLMQRVSEVQRLMVEGGAVRDHERAGKCRNCSRRHACTERLA